MASGVTDLALRPPGPSGLGRDELIRAFRLMYLSRRIDDREILLKRQSKIYFQISGAGHEAIQTAAGMVLKPGHDWFFPYYRDRALCLTLGMTPEDMLLQAVGAESDPSSGGRQMPSHWSNPRLHIVSPSSATGTQFLPAVGCADAQRRLEPGTDAITVTATGEGATSEGEFWESLNVACLEKLAILYLVEDNGWAISVPVEKQTAGGNIAKLVSGFPNLKIFECDGSDFLASYAIMSEAVEYCRRTQSPVLVHAQCTRPYSHSLSDDERLRVWRPFYFWIGHQRAAGNSKVHYAHPFHPACLFCSFCKRKFQAVIPDHSRPVPVLIAEARRQRQVIAHHQLLCIVPVVHDVQDQLIFKESQCRTHRRFFKSLPGKGRICRCRWINGPGQL